MSTPTIDELRLAVAFHREALTKVEKQLYDLECPPETRPTTKKVMRKRAVDMETRAAYKLHWKMAIEQGLVENVQGILNECADYLCHDKEDLGAEFVTVAKTRFGKADSLQRQEFTLLVIKYLKHNGSFIDEEGGFDTFEDTAGGCDEVTQDAAMYLIKNPEWTV
jgi:hypothetical protein